MAATPADTAPAAQAAPAKAAAPASPSRLANFSGVGLAILIFLFVILAWRSAPFTPPPRHKIDPSELKLDRSLDLQRVSPKGN